MTFLNTPSRMVRTTCTSTSPASGGSTTGGSCSLLRRLPAQPEVLGHVRDRGPAQAHRRVMPADLAAGDVARRVVRVSGVEREVDPADEGDAVVDDDRLLVVAVERADARVHLALDRGLGAELVAHETHVCARGPEEPPRRTAPQQHAHVDPLRQLRQEIANDDGIVSPRQLQVRRQVPAGDVDVRLGLRKLLGDRGKRGGAVDQHLEVVALTRWRSGARVAATRRVERVLPADAAKAAPVPRPNGVLDPLGDPLAEVA